MTSNPKPSASPPSAEKVPDLFIEAPSTSQPAANSGIGMKRESPATTSDEPEPPTKVSRTVSIFPPAAWGLNSVTSVKRHPSGELEASMRRPGPTIPDEEPDDQDNEDAFVRICSVDQLPVSTACNGMTAHKAVAQFSNIGKFVKDLEKQAKKASDETSKLRGQVKTIQQESDKLMLRTTANHKTQVNKLKNEVRHWKAEAEESEKARQIDDLRKQLKVKEAELEKAGKKYESVMNAASGVVASQAVDLSKMIVKLDKAVLDCKKNGL